VIAFEPVVDTDWLAARLGDGNLRVVDGSWHMPQAKRDPRREFVDAHIPGAVFFDIDQIADPDTKLPHMLPSAEKFAHAVGRLGIGDGDRIVVYDTRGVVSAARVWWSFRVFGHDQVAVLDGGFPKWRAEGRPVDTGVSVPKERTFTPKPRPALVRDLSQMRANLTSSGEQVVDARSRGRFAGTEPEPRPGLRGGHIPGSLNLPYEELYHPDGTLLPADALRRAFVKAGIDLDKPVATTCGSGVTASVLALGLYVIGHRTAAVYDGSWAEWGGRADTPLERQGARQEARRS
jgi:thiosulfate/3-mercaptopyruvate sulfurtransferase